MLPDQVLGRRRPDGSALISVSEMRDGIVTFEDEAEAARFGALLEADRQAEVRPYRLEGSMLLVRLLQRLRATRRRPLALAPCWRRTARLRRAPLSVTLSVELCQRGPGQDQTAWRLNADVGSQR